MELLILQQEEEHQVIVLQELLEVLEEVEEPLEEILDQVQVVFLEEQVILRQLVHHKEIQVEVVQAQLEVLLIILYQQLEEAEELLQ